MGGFHIRDSSRWTGHGTLLHLSEHSPPALVDPLRATTQALDQCSRGPSRKTLCPALPSLQWVPWVSVPHLPRYYAPLRLPPARLGSLHSTFASRYRACFTV